MRRHIYRSQLESSGLGIYSYHFDLDQYQSTQLLRRHIGNPLAIACILGTRILGEYLRLADGSRFCDGLGGLKKGNFQSHCRQSPSCDIGKLSNKPSNGLLTGILQSLPIFCDAFIIVILFLLC